MQHQELSFVEIAKHLGLVQMTQKLWKQCLLHFSVPFCPSIQLKLATEFPPLMCFNLLDFVVFALDLFVGFACNGDVEMMCVWKVMVLWHSQPLCFVASSHVQL